MCIAGSSQNNITNPIATEEIRTEIDTAKDAAGLNGWVEYMAKSSIRYASGIEIADIDGMYQPDLFVITGDLPGLLWLQAPPNPLNNSNWMNYTIYSTTACYYMKPHDINNDGRPDLIAIINSNATYYDLVWFQHPGGMGNGTWQKYVIAYNIQPWGEIQIADMNKDGRKDIITIDYSGAKPAIYLTPTDIYGSWPSVSIISMSQASGEDALVVVDIDGDNDTDIFTTGMTSVPTNQIVWLEAPTTYSAINFTTRIIDSIIAQDLAVADIDKANRLDLFAIQKTTGALYWYAGPANASGTWTKTLINNTKSYTRMQIVDFNNDTRPDVLAIASDNSINLFICPENPYGTWLPPKIIAQGSSYQLYSHSNPAIMDVDIDGLKDVLVCSNVVNGNVTWLKQPLSVTTPSAPQNLWGTPGDSYVQLYWNAPMTDGGSPITNYQIYRGLNEFNLTLINTVGNVFSYWDGNLTNNLTYYYKVAAINSIGTGPLSNIWNGTPMMNATVPSAPQNLWGTAGDKYVQLYWNAPVTDGGSPITNYQIYRGLNEFNLTLINTVGNVFSYWDGNLTNNLTYYYKVAAINSIGTGPLSNIWNATPMANTTKPSAPMNLVSIPGNGYVVLNWNAPMFDGGEPVYAYRIYRGFESGNETYLVDIGNVNYYNDTSVVNGNLYFYKVSAFNINGESPLSIGTNATPQASDITPPNINSVYSQPMNPTIYDEIYIYAHIYDNSGIIDASVEIWMNGSYFGLYPMTYIGNDTYYYYLGLYGANTTIQYSIMATDGSPNNNMAYNNNGGSYYWIFVQGAGEDWVGPNIGTPWYTTNQNNSDYLVFVYCDISDPSGIFQAAIFYRINYGVWLNASMWYDAGIVYGSYLGTYAEGTVIEFYIMAWDNSIHYNGASNNNYGNNFYVNLNNADDFTPPMIHWALHNPDPVYAFDDIYIYSNITDESGVLGALVYYQVNGGELQNVSMWFNASIGIYQAHLGAYPENTSIDYYIIAFDDSVNYNWADYPASSSINIYVNMVGPDILSPVIQSQWFDPDPAKNWENITIYASIYDNYGVNQVWVHLSINNGTWFNLAMSQVPAQPNIYRTTIGAFTTGTYIQFYIQAVDFSNNWQTGGIDVIFVQSSEDLTGPQISNIYHSPNNPDSTNIIMINATVVDISGISSVYLYYRINAAAYNILEMNLGPNSNYYCQIGPFTEGTFIDYYINATDNSPYMNSAIGKNGSFDFTFTIQAPNEFDPPVISNVLFLPSIVYVTSQIYITANVTDLSGVQTVVLIYKINNSAWMNVSMSPSGINRYEYTMNPQSVGSIIEFYIWARDNSQNHNIGINNNSGNNWRIVVQIENIMPIITSPPDITYQVGTTGHIITWTITDSTTGNGTDYVIFRNGQNIRSGFWQNGDNITTNIDGLAVGIHFFEIRVFDGLGGNATDIVQVTVNTNQTTNNPPNISASTNQTEFNHTIGSNQAPSISWTLTDSNMGNAFYQIIINTTIVTNTSWLNGTVVVVNMNTLQLNNAYIVQTAGTYEIRIIAFDGLGLNTSASVILKVISSIWTQPQNFTIDLAENVTQPIRVNRVDIRWLNNIVPNAEYIIVYLSNAAFVQSDLDIVPLPNHIVATTINARTLDNLSPGDINKHQISNLQNGTYYVCVVYTNPLGKAYSNIKTFVVELDPTPTNTQNSNPFAVPSGIDGIPLPVLCSLSVGVIAIFIVKNKKRFEFAN
jgi:hypothetical protein